MCCTKEMIIPILGDNIDPSRGSLVIKEERRDRIWASWLNQVCEVKVTQSCLTLYNPMD